MEGVRHSLANVYTLNWQGRSITPLFIAFVEGGTGRKIFNFSQNFFVGDDKKVHVSPELSALGA